MSIVFTDSNALTLRPHTIEIGNVRFVRPVHFKLRPGMRVLFWGTPTCLPFGSTIEVEHDDRRGPHQGRF